ncbi:MAG: hypothetical protein V4581_09465 [Bacteroidota bacterium]
MKPLLLFITLLSLSSFHVKTMPVKTYSVGYIYLDGKKMHIAEINALRKKIIEEYKSGTDFKTLIDTYNMDHNPVARNYNFNAEEVVPEFTSAVKEHNVGDIFTVDVPDNKWYYVVLRNPDAD